VDLSTPVTYVKGVGPQRAEQLEAKGLATAGDLLFYPPFRYEDRSNVKPLAELAPGEMATVLATVRTLHKRRFRKRDLGLVEAIFEDATGRSITAKWFHAHYLDRVFVPGVRVALFGKVEFDAYISKPTGADPAELPALELVETKPDRFELVGKTDLDAQC